VEPVVGHGCEVAAPRRRSRSRGRYRNRALALSTVAGIVMLIGWLPGQALAATAAGSLLVPTGGGCTAPPAVTVAAHPAGAGRGGVALRGGATLDSAVSVSLAGAAAADDPSADPTPTPTPSQADPTPTPTPSQAGPTPTQADPTPTPSQAVPTPTPSQAVPTPTPSGGATSSPSPSPSTGSTPPGSATVPTLCVEVQAPTSGVGPGTTDTYLIWVWTTGAAARRVTVTAATVQVAGVGAPQFTTCPAPGGSVCTLGNLSTGHALELAASVSVAASVAAGNEVTLIATALGTQAASDQAEASAIVTAGAGTPGSYLLPPDLPGSLTSLPGNGNLTNLFPVVAPGTGQNPDPPAHAGRDPRGVEATTVSETLPLDGRLMDGQLAGLAVLACAVAAGILRLSLRRPQPQSAKETSR
jgi:hypothetical protein